ncbi:urease accessory protein UreE [filamentous cyanobacterium LEGE 11480]|uniref:Urease accessory protein UreE n=1 Tax=Romeriopsis navalis LEGE 11480 TaxID=2777977 RepID=A0A928VVG6_9CYAN|nr:urease accessory protein UreE [Romeriopsis navalis]MBE9032799.1 urease accessory protein UreE [Romeriopsis navalis LEGE 11480]
MVVLTRRLAPDSQAAVIGILPLTADERTRSRYRHDLPDGSVVFLQLPRGTVLQDGDLLQADDGQQLRVSAKPEPVLTVTAATPLALMLATYHLGNRHVPLEVTDHYLRLAPDSVLQAMLVEQLQVQVKEEMAPFCPQAGAYQHHAHTHDDHRHDHHHHH